MPKIIVTGGDGEQTYPCGPDELAIGRARTNTIVLPGGGVSRQHATIAAEGMEYFLTDCGSENGTLLNGRPLRANERVLLRDNDVLGIDTYRLRFYRIDERLEQSFNEITDSDVLEVKLLRKVLNALDKETIPSLEVLNGAAEGKRLLFTDDLEVVTVGRDPMSDFPVEEYVVSRRHAKFLQRPEGIAVHDLGSKNGTYVNQTRVIEQLLHDGDRVAFGTIVCIFRNPREVNLAAVSEHVKRTRAPAPAAKPAAAAAQPVEASETPGEPTDDAAPADAGSLPDAEALTERERAHNYPAPRAGGGRFAAFSRAEMGLLWASVVVFLTTLVLLVRLLS